MRCAGWVVTVLIGSCFLAAALVSGNPWYLLGVAAALALYLVSYFKEQV